MEKKIKVCFINSVCGFGSTGRIVEDLASMEGIDSLIIYGRNKSNNPKAYRMTNLFGNAVAAVNTILFNKNGLSNKRETKKAIEKIKEFNPDVIHLHNLHGYYINYEILFNFLKEFNKPVIWTLHDCWSFTGYCPHFDYIGCDKYKTECNKQCPYKFAYPFSIFKQGIQKQYKLKKSLLSRFDNLTLVTPSNWLKEKATESFFNNTDIEVINNGVDTSVFKPSVPKNKDFTILFVSSIWTKKKGRDEIEKLLPLIDKDIKVIVVGKIKTTSLMKKKCVLIDRTNNKEELRDLYSQSHLFINPTLEDNYPTVNLEALACGTPVITYNTGGSTEMIKDKMNIVDKFDINALANTINSYKRKQINTTSLSNKLLDKKTMLNKYNELYKLKVKN